MKKTLVTGGNIGNYVAEGLAEKRIPVRVLVRRPKANRRWNELGIEQVAGDLADINAVASAFDGVERFFSVTPFVENLVQLGINGVEAAKRARIGHIVRSSALGASDGSITIARWHREIETAIEASGIPYTILQPNTFMQSYFMQAETIKAANAFYMPQGEGRVSLVDVRDIAAVAVACLTETGHVGKTYVVTGGEALSNYDIAQTLSAGLGRPIAYHDVTPEQAQESLAKAGVSARMTQALLELFAICKAGYAAQVSPVVEQIAKRKPISFAQFLNENIAAFRTNLEIAGVA